MARVKFDFYAKRSVRDDRYIVTATKDDTETVFWFTRKEIENLINTLCAAVSEKEDVGGDG